MRSRLDSLILVVTLLAAMAAPAALRAEDATSAAPNIAAPRLPHPDLLTHAGSDHYWLAQVLPPTAGGSQRTAVRVRRASGGAGWERVIVAYGRAVDLAHRGESVVLLLEDGSWLLAWPGGSSTGPALPGGAEIRAMGSSDLSLWAVGSGGTSGDDVEAATTEPADRGTGNALLRLYLYTDEGWESRATLPAVVPTDAQLSVTVHGGRPMIAALVGPRRVLVLRLARDQQWEVEEIDTSHDIRQFELLGQTPNPVLWTSDPSGPGVLHPRRGDGWGPPVELNAEQLPRPAIARAVEYFAGSLRLAWWDGEQLFERAYSLDGQPVTEATALGRTPPAAVEPVGSGTLIMLGALAALLAINIFKTDENEGIVLGDSRSQLAPLPRRFVAGLIDLTPLIVVAIWQLTPRSADASLAEALQEESFTIWMAIGTAIYLLHTTLSEVLTGKTIGKAACGLRTATLDNASRPRFMALLLRNVFRIVDVMPVLPLALLILFSPLRQRLGDVIAGTVVVMDVELEPPAESSEQKE